jgi:hypothetical protein
MSDEDFIERMEASLGTLTLDLDDPNFGLAGSLTLVNCRLLETSFKDDGDDGEET